MVRVREPGVRRRRDAGRIRLTGRDIDVLTWIAEQYAIDLDHLSLILGRPSSGLGISATRRVLSRLHRAGLIRSEKLLANAPSYSWVTRKGLKLLGLGFTPWEPTVGFLGHLSAVNELRIALDRAGDRREWVSERRLRQGKGVGTHVPDAELRDPDTGESIAIEIERSQKGRERLDSIAYKLAGAYAKSWVFANPASPAWRSWERLLDDLSLSDRVQPFEPPPPTLVNGSQEAQR